MAERVMEHPAVADDAGLEAVHQLEEPVQDRLLEHREVLVMMVEGADGSARDEPDDHPENEPGRGVDQREREDVTGEEGGDQRDGKAVLAMAEELHGKHSAAGL